MKLTIIAKIREARTRFLQPQCFKGELNSLQIGTFYLSYIQKGAAYLYFRIIVGTYWDTVLLSSHWPLWRGCSWGVWRPAGVAAAGQCATPAGPGQRRVDIAGERRPGGGRSHWWGAAGCLASRGGWWQQSRAGDGGRGSDQLEEDVPLVLAQRVGHTGAPAICNGGDGSGTPPRSRGTPVGALPCPPHDCRQHSQLGRVVRPTLKVAEVGGLCPCETQLLE